MKLKIFILIQLLLLPNILSGPNLDNIKTNFYLYHYHYLYNIWDYFSSYIDPFISPDDILSKKIKSIKMYSVVEYASDTTVFLRSHMVFDSLGGIIKNFAKISDIVLHDIEYKYEYYDDGRPKFMYQKVNDKLYNPIEFIYDKNDLLVKLTDRINDEDNDLSLEYDDENELINSNYMSVNKCGKFEASYLLESYFFGLFNKKGKEILFLGYDSLCRLRYKIDNGFICSGSYYFYDDKGKMSKVYLSHASNLDTLKKNYSEDNFQNSLDSIYIGFTPEDLPSEYHKYSQPWEKTVFEYTFWNDAAYE